MPADVLDLSASLGFIDEIYDRYRADPASVDPSWAALFDGAPAPAKKPGGANGASGSNGPCPW
ncbi:MAG TPA: hypothetical protein PLW65_29575, partial [Pseudomonadota bacterium]|nr:hypothetical protein [Pseudomonadota bacterium]